jgi:hypothetical protein
MEFNVAASHGNHTTTWICTRPSGLDEARCGVAGGSDSIESIEFELGPFITLGTTSGVGKSWLLGIDCRIEYNGGDENWQEIKNRMLPTTY